MLDEDVRRDPVLEERQARAVRQDVGHAGQQIDVDEAIEVPAPTAEM
jgi:hypothetical protein